MADANLCVIVNIKLLLLPFQRTPFITENEIMNLEKSSNGLVLGSFIDDTWVYLNRIGRLGVVNPNREPSKITPRFITRSEVIASRKILRKILDAIPANGLTLKCCALDILYVKRKLERVPNSKFSKDVNSPLRQSICKESHTKASPTPENKRDAIKTVQCQSTP